MIEYKQGDILEAKADALVNTVNCVGVMGRGVALQFKKAWPANFKAYESACKANEVRPGRMFVFETGRLDSPKFIINFPTKRHWRGRSRMEDVDTGLRALADEIERRGIRSIAVPPLGAGLGGLPWQEVRDRIEARLGGLADEVEITVFEPSGTPEPRPAKEPPKMTRGRAALVGLMDRYVRGLLDPFVSLLELHKLMYFMQEAGEPLRLRWMKGHYGPYAENLRHVLTEIEASFVSGYGFGGDEPDKILEVMPGALEQANRVLAAHPKTQARFDRVSRLVEGFESPFGLELLATVHYVMKHEGVNQLEEVVGAVRSWSQRKAEFTREQVDLARTVLREQTWV